MPLRPTAGSALCGAGSCPRVPPFIAGRPSGPSRGLLPLATLLTASVSVPSRTQEGRRFHNLQLRSAPHHSLSPAAPSTMANLAASRPDSFGKIILVGGTCLRHGGATELLKQQHTRLAHGAELCHAGRARPRARAIVRPKDVSPGQSTFSLTAELDGLRTGTRSTAECLVSWRRAPEATLSAEAQVS